MANSNGGDWIADRHADILVAEQEMFSSGRSQIELFPHINSARAVLENQTANLDPVMTTGGECIGVNVSSLRFCDETVTNRLETPYDCDLDGPEGFADAILLKKNFEWSAEFSVIDDECRGQYGIIEKTAHGLASRKARLLEKLNEAVISKLTSDAMQSAYDTPLGNRKADVVEYLTANWDVNLMGEFHTHRAFNKIQDAVLLHGTNFYSEFYMAMFKDCCENDKGVFGDWKHYWDLFSVPSILGTNSSILFDAGSLVFFNLNEFENTTPEYLYDKGGFAVWKDESVHLSYNYNGRLIPVTFDIYAQRVCKVFDKAAEEASTEFAAGKSNKRKWGTTYQVVLTAGLHSAPADCDGGTGIIQFDNVGSYTT